MKDFPLNDLLSSTGLVKVHESLIFSHLSRKLRISPYPLPLIEAISRDFNDALLRILTCHWLACTPYPTFDHLLAQTTARGIFKTWVYLMTEFTNVTRQVTKKRREWLIPIKVVPAHGKLVEWVRYVTE